MIKQESVRSVRSITIAETTRKQNAATSPLRPPEPIRQQTACATPGTSRTPQSSVVLVRLAPIASEDLFDRNRARFIARRKSTPASQSRSANAIPDFTSSPTVIAKYAPTATIVRTVRKSSVRISIRSTKAPSHLRIADVAPASMKSTATARNAKRTISALGRSI